MCHLFLQSNLISILKIEYNYTLIKTHKITPKNRHNQMESNTSIIEQLIYIENNTLKTRPVIVTYKTVNGVAIPIRRAGVFIDKSGSQIYCKGHPNTRICDGEPDETGLCGICRSTCTACESRIVIGNKFCSECLTTIACKMPGCSSSAIYHDCNFKLCGDGHLSVRCCGKTVGLCKCAVNHIGLPVKAEKLREISYINGDRFILEDPSRGYFGKLHKWPLPENFPTRVNLSSADVWESLCPHDSTTWKTCTPPVKKSFGCAGVSQDAICAKCRKASENKCKLCSELLISASDIYKKAGNCRKCMRFRRCDICKEAIWTKKGEMKIGRCAGCVMSTRAILCGGCNIEMSFNSRKFPYDLTQLTELTSHTTQLTIQHCIECKKPNNYYRFLLWEKYNIYPWVAKFITMSRARIDFAAAVSIVLHYATKISEVDAQLNTADIVKQKQLEYLRKIPNGLRNAKYTLYKSHNCAASALVLMRNIPFDLCLKIMRMVR